MELGWLQCLGGVAGDLWGGHSALLVCGKASNASEVDFPGKSPQCSCAEFSP